MNIARAHHLHDDTLYEAYLTARRGVPIDPRLAEHLADCPACERRYAELAGVMDDLATAADADVDRVFPAERRRAQQARILDRVTHAGRPARVLSFPGQAVARRLGAARPRIATRWIAAGAAAGLFIGVGLGLFLNDTTPAPERVAASHPAAAVTASRLAATPSRTAADDDAFLTDLDLALESPRTSELRGYDALTPRVRDVVDIR